jgi:cysteine-rich repeat protein
MGLIAALGLPVAVLQATETITFNDLMPGQVVGTINLPGMGTVVIKGIRPGLPDPPDTNFAITFPSNAPPGLDFDLGSPNETCGGPGVSSDGAGEADGAHPNCAPPDGPLDPNDPNIPLNNVLIVADNLTDNDFDGLVDVPNDHAGDNNLIIKFLDKSVRFTSIALLDIQAPLAESATVFLYADVDCSDLIAEIELDDTGDNGLIVFKFEPFAPSRCMIVDVNGSGAIDNITVNACGDGVVDDGEECDDGNDDNTDGCHNDCTEGLCGDGAVDDGEQCDDGNDNDHDECSNDCTSGCGNGIVNTGEQCDDGNENNNDGCRNNCTTPSCGDGIVDSGEQCDDGNTNNDDACRNNCTQVSCGDGVLDSGEQCDDGNDNDNDACSNDCTNGCGNGIVNTGEECDDGNDNDHDACSNNCTSGCGNGIVNSGEECDDGNEVDDDGCSNDCTVPDCVPDLECDFECVEEECHGEGCTPGYWKQTQHFCNWSGPYDPSDLFADHFENAFPGKTLLYVLGQGGGGLNALGRHTVAALLNGGSDGVCYDLDDNDVVQQFNAVYPGGDYESLKNKFASFNEQDCPLNNCRTASRSAAWRSVQGGGSGGGDDDDDDDDGDGGESGRLVLTFEDHNDCGPVEGRIEACGKSVVVESGQVVKVDCGGDEHSDDDDDGAYCRLEFDGDVLVIEGADSAVLIVTSPGSDDECRIDLCGAADECAAGEAGRQGSARRGAGRGRPAR